MKYLLIILSFLSAYLPIPLLGQSVEGYTKQKELIKDHINLLDKNLETRKTERLNILSQYDLARNKILQRQLLVDLITQELQLVDELQQKASERYSALSEDMSNDRKALAQIVRQDFYQDLIKSKRSTLVSPKGLIQMGVKDRYIAHIRDRLSSELSMLDQSKSIAEDSIRFLAQLKQDKLHLLSQEEISVNDLKGDVKQSQSILATIQKDEARLKENLMLQQSEERRISESLKKMTFKVGKQTSDITTGGEAGFANRKKSLLWPVDNGIVTEHFGIKRHPSINNIKVENNGVDMLCQSNTAVQSIYPGRVILINQQDPYGYIVIINHDDYTSAYYNLKNVIVEKDSQLAEGQKIGYLSDQQEGASFHFEIWYDQKHLDPEEWLRNR